MDAAFVTTTAELDALAKEWLALEQRDPYAPYHTRFRFVRAWWEGFADKSGTELLVVTVRHNNRLVGVLPLSVRRERRSGHPRRVVRFATYGDYKGPTLDPTHRSDTILRRALAVLEERPRWDQINLSNIPATSPLVAHALKRPRLNEALKLHIENPYLDLSDFKSFADFEAAGVPRNARKYRNRLVHRHAVTFHVLAGSQAHGPSLLERVAALHRAEKEYLIRERGRIERHSVFENPHRRTHIGVVWRNTDDAVTFAYKRPDGTLVAYRTSFRSGRALLSWNSAYHPDHRDDRIGRALQYDIFAHLFAAEPEAVFDFGAGRYPWKFEWTSTFSTTYRLRLDLTPTQQVGATPTAAKSTDVTSQGAGPSGEKMTAGSVSQRAKVTGDSTASAPRWRSPRRLVRGLARRLRTAVRRARQRGVTVWYAPHPDDETLFFGGAIAGNRRRRNVVVMLTRGGASRARKKVSVKLGEPFGRKAFMAARVRELRAATRHIGVEPRDLIIIHDLPDGGLTQGAVREVIAAQARKYPKAEHRTMSPHDPHPDHAAAGAALLAAWRDGEVVDCQFYWPVPVVSADLGEPVTIDSAAAAAKRAALDEYKRWDPDRGRYAIGALSVPRLIDAQLTSPTERTHAPDADAPPECEER